MRILSPSSKLDWMVRHDLDEVHTFYSSELPDQLLAMGDAFRELWNLHPADFHEIMMHGRLVKTPRWQQAYGADYHYTGGINRALPIPAILEPFHEWVRSNIDSRLNGLLLNWYDGCQGHYIGAHRDSTKNMIHGAAIVTVSLGEDRVFRLRPWKGKGYRDFLAKDGTVFVMPYATNLTWTHEVPSAKRFIGLRISLTFRAFRK